MIVLETGSAAAAANRVASDDPDGLARGRGRGRGLAGADMMCDGMTMWPRSGAEFGDDGVVDLLSQVMVMGIVERQHCST